MTKAYDKAIRAVDDAIVKNRSLTPEEAVEALENVRERGGPARGQPGRERSGRERSGVMTILISEVLATAEALAQQSSDGSNPIRDALTRELIRDAKALAAEVDRMQAKYSKVVVFMDNVRDTARGRNPNGATILDFMAVWNEQYQERHDRQEKKIEGLQAIVDRSGDVCPCSGCGEPVVCAAEGIALCNDCDEKARD